jgi:hypothetical protein
MELTSPKRIRRDAGFTLIDMLFVVGLIGLLASLAIPGLMRARGAAQASSALGSLRVINGAELTYAITCGLGFYAADLPTLGIPPRVGAEGYLPKEMSSGFTYVKSGFSFSLAGTPIAGSPAPCNGVGAGKGSTGYAVVADPLDPVANIGKFFGTNADALIFVHSSSLAAVMPETGVPTLGKPIQ